MSLVSGSSLRLLLRETAEEKAASGVTSRRFDKKNVLDGTEGWPRPRARHQCFQLDHEKIDLIKLFYICSKKGD